MKKRDSVLDFLKGFGILLMVMGHIGFGSHFDHIIHMFHMPLFFILAGCVFNPLNYNLAKRAKRLFVPYIVFVVINITVSISCNTIDYKWFANAILCPTDSIAGVAWFLPVLFGAQSIVVLEYRLLRTQKSVFIISVLLMCVAIVLPRNMLFSIETMLFSQFYIVIGMIIKGQKIHMKSFRGWVKWLLLSVGIVYALWNGTNNLRTGNYGKIPIMYPIISVLIVVMLIAVCRNRWVEKDKVITYFGRYSLVYMGFNQNLIMLNAFLLGCLCSWSGIVGNILFKLGELILILIECSVLVILLKKLKLKWLY